MKTTFITHDQPAGAGRRAGPGLSASFPFAAPKRNAGGRAFTIVELLVVIAIIGILAALVLPALAGVKRRAQITQAKKEISDIVSGIQQYDSVYGRFPVSSEVQNQAAQNARNGLNPDFTYGGDYKTPNPASPLWPVTPTSIYPPNYSLYLNKNNSEVVAILMDLTNYPNGSLTVNTNHQKNPQRTIFLGAKMSGYDPASNDPQPPGGVDNTGVYRDPWGNPYAITLDLNYDEQCQDAFYCSNTVSGPYNPGLNGLTSPTATTTVKGNDDFLYHGKVMAWSAGPDGKVDSSKPANVDVNKDNVLSWQ